MITGETPPKSLKGGIKSHALCNYTRSDLKNKAGSRFFYSDVTVVCDGQCQHDYDADSPVIAVEALYKTSLRVGETTKRSTCQNIPA